MESITSSRKEHTTSYKTDNRTNYDILNQICKNTGVKQYKFKQDGRGDTTAPEAEAAFQASTYDGKKKACNWEKYVSYHVKYHIIFENLKGYWYQGLEPGTKIDHLLNGIRCNKMSTEVTIIKARPERCEKDFDLLLPSQNMLKSKDYQ